MGILELRSRERSRVFYVEFQELECQDSVQTVQSQASQETTKDPPSEAPSKSPSPETNLPEQVKSVLQLWLSLPSPYLHQGAVFELARITSGSQQITTKKTLLNQALIREHKLQLKKTRISVWEPLESAYKAVGIPKHKLASKGGYLHNFIAHHTAAYAKAQGYLTDIEFYLSNNKAVDLILRKPQETIFVEIAVSKPLSKEITNLTRDIETALVPDRLIIVVVDSKAKKAVEKLIKEYSQLSEFQDKLQVALAGEYIQIRGGSGV